MTLDECRPGMRVHYRGAPYPDGYATLVSVVRMLHDPSQGFADIRPDTWPHKRSTTQVLVKGPEDLQCVSLANVVSS